MSALSKWMLLLFCAMYLQLYCHFPYLFIIHKFDWLMVLTLSKQVSRIYFKPLSTLSCGRFVKRLVKSAQNIWCSLDRLTFLSLFNTLALPSIDQYELIPFLDSANLQ